MADRDLRGDVGDDGADVDEAESERSPAEIVDEWQHRAWGDGDLSAVDELVSEPFVRHGVTGSARRTRDELKHDLRQYQKALGKPVITVHDRVVDGDKVWSRVSMRGASLQTGERRTIDWLQIHRVVGGQIAEVWTLHATDVDWQDLS